MLETPTKNATNATDNASANISPKEASKSALPAKKSSSRIDNKGSGNTSTKCDAGGKTLKVPKIVVSQYVEPQMLSKRMKLQPLAVSPKSFGINGAFSLSQSNSHTMGMVDTFKRTPTNSPLKALSNGSEKHRSDLIVKQLTRVANVSVGKGNKENIPIETVSNRKDSMANERFPKRVYISPVIAGRRPIRHMAPAVETLTAKQCQPDVST